MKTKKKYMHYPLHLHAVIAYCGCIRPARHLAFFQQRVDAHALAPLASPNLNPLHCSMALVSLLSCQRLVPCSRALDAAFFWCCLPLADTLPIVYTVTTRTISLLPYQRLAPCSRASALDATRNAMLQPATCPRQTHCPMRPMSIA